MCNGAKLAVASVARATPLFLPRPEISYINVLHYSAPPRTYLLRATPPLCPDWRHCLFHSFDTQSMITCGLNALIFGKGQFLNLVYLQSCCIKFQSQNFCGLMAQ